MTDGQSSGDARKGDVFFFGDERAAEQPERDRAVPAARAAMPSAPPSPAAAAAADADEEDASEPTLTGPLAAVAASSTEVDGSVAASASPAATPSSPPPPPSPAAVPPPPPAAALAAGAAVDHEPPNGFVAWLAGPGIVAILTVILALAGIAFVLFDPASPRGAAASVTGGVEAGDLTWVGDIDAGFEQAAADGRHVLVLFTADWCPPCHEMKASTLSDPAVRARLARDFVTVKVDLTERGGPNDRVAHAHSIRSIPSVRIYDAQGYEKGAFGYVGSPAEFGRMVSAAVD